MKVKKIYYLWKCRFCGNKNKMWFYKGFAIVENNRHHAWTWNCNKCGKEHYIEMYFLIDEIKYYKK